MPQKPSYEDLEKRIRELEKAEAECKTAEEALRETEERFRVIFESSRDAIFITAPDARFSFVNNAACRLTGYSEKALLSMGIPDLHEQEDLTAYKTFFHRIMSGEDILSEAELLRKDGIKLPVEFNNTRVFINNQKFMHTTARDISERRQAEEELSKRLEAIEASMDGIAILNRNEEYIYLNDTHAMIYGYDSPDELLGKTWRILYHERELELFENKIMPAFMEAGKCRGESVGRKKNGDAFPQEVSLTALKNGGLVCVVRDVSRQKKAESDKLKAQKTAAQHEKYALVGQIAGKMAHDFNNVLGAVMGNTELALIGCREEETKETLELILNLTIRGKNLTRNLVAFAKDQEPKTEYFSIHKKIDLVLILLEKEMQGITVINRPGTKLPDLFADQEMIENCLVNILQNAIHALGKTPEPILRIQTFRKGKQLYIEIKDNGCGIPAAYISNIYDPAFTLKGSRDRAGAYLPGIKGTGYGMANVKKYMDQHNGTIAVESGPGKGTTVTLGFPIVERAVSDSNPAEQKAAPTCTGKKVLIVEDEKPISDVQYMMLTQGTCSHSVDTAEDGRTAMELIDRNTYDAVSLDYVLPGNINGMDVYAHIRKTDKTLPILFISGNLEFLESIKDLKQKDPCIDHVSKPCQNREYLDRINRLLGF